MMANGSREASTSSSTLVPSVIIETLVDSGAKSLRGKMHSVPPSLQLKQQQHQHQQHREHQPMVVSLGPYHHGKPLLQQVEEYKQKSLAMFVSDSGRDEGFFYSRNSSKSMKSGVATLECQQILQRRGALYNDASRFLLPHMLHEGSHGDREMNFHMSHLRASASALMDPNMYMLKDQIPYSVIKLLIESRLGGNEGKSLLCKYFSSVSFGEDQILEKIPWEDDKEEESLHLLEAFQKMFSGDSSRKKSEKNNQDSYNFRNLSSEFRCVTDLKEKGKDFKPSSNCSSLI